jgi:class 3 adenylate cyclase
MIRAEGGAITSYDGDRVMSIFIGDTQCTPAARCALKLNYVVQNVLNPAFKRQYTDDALVVRQVVGIDVSSINAARTGVRGGNDIVWVGRAANYAAKLCDLRTDGVRT